MNAILKNSLGEEEKVRAASQGGGSHFHFPSIRGSKTEQPWKRRCLCGLLGLNISILKGGFLPPNFKTCKMATRRSPPSIGIPNKRRRLRDCGRPAN